MKNESTAKPFFSLSGSWSRRSFLKTSLAAAALPNMPVPAAAVKMLKRMPSIPTVDDLAGARIVHKLRDFYSSPTTQNEFGYAQATKSVSGIAAISFPPYSCCGVPIGDTPYYSWTSLLEDPLHTCEIYLNGRLLESYPEGGDEMAYRWYPHKIVRETQTQGLRFTTETFMPAKRRAVAQSIRVRNVTGESRKFTLAFNMRAAVAKITTPWLVNAPVELDNLIHWDGARGCLIFEAQHSQVVSVQGISPKPTHVELGRMLVLELMLGSGEVKELQYVNVVDADGQAALAEYDQLQAAFPRTMLKSEQEFNSLLKSAFTPGNSDFSGYLPRLETDDESLWQLYMNGVKNLLFARRASPDSKYGTTYLSGCGRVLPTLSYPWDTSLSSLSLALLDPEAVRRLVETWFIQGMDQHFATDYVTGEGVGGWYGVNDMAIVRCARDYLRITGDMAWLDKRIGDRTALDHLTFHATYWKQLDKNGHGLGDYGTIWNLLEVVSTYLHDTAAMNSGNVSSMRFVADLQERRGNTCGASQLRAEASELAQRINQQLYVDGKGWWRCRRPDGSLVEVRHCYDFLTVLDNMFEDLSESQKKEMSHFFWQELHSDYWMYALSSSDADATWNTRPDHSWLGAYAAWPPMCAKGLYKIAPSARISVWVKNLAKVFNQGPVGQSHFAETVYPLEHGGVTKAPADPPYSHEWSAIAGGAFTDLVIDTIFGANLTLYDGVKAQPLLADFDLEARLVNLRYQGTDYVISSKGVSSAG